MVLFRQILLFWTINTAAAQQGIVLPPLPVPFNPVWANAEVIRLTREIEKFEPKIQDVMPRMIRLWPRNQARKAWLVARRRQIMNALGL